MLTFSQHLQNDLEEEGRTDVGKVLIANISSTFCYHFAEWLEVLLAKVLAHKQKVYAHLL